MDILLPPQRMDDHPITLKGVHNITLIGANGAGKSRFAHEIEQRYAQNTIHLSAIDALCYNPDREREGGSNSHSITARYCAALQQGARPFLTATEPQTEFEQLLYILMQEEFYSLQEFKERVKQDPTFALPHTLLDRTQAIWQRLFPNLRLVRSEGALQVLDTHAQHTYNASRMSQGERVAFYMIAASLLAQPQSIIVVEDPDAHLHRSITQTLWNTIEQECPACTFIYLTHDIEFATSRMGGVRLWIKSFDADHHTWEYKFIPDSDHLPEEVYLEILGSRKPILFIEGTEGVSIDNKLYPLLFPHYMVKPLGGCTRVIETTRAFAEMNHFHHLQSMGIVDRDRRTDREVEKLRQQHIFVPRVAEVENLFMIEGVIRVVARRMMKPENKVANKVKRNVIELFAQEVEAQALLHTRHRVRRKLEYMIDRRLHTIDELVTHIDTLTDGIDPEQEYSEILSLFKEYIATSNYEEILRIYNQKGMLPQSRVAPLCDLAGKEQYIALVLSILRENRADAEEIRKAMLKVFDLENNNLNESI